jgi:hypothetical protein
MSPGRRDVLRRVREHRSAHRLEQSGRTRSRTVSSRADGIFNRHNFTANDFRVTRALDSLLISAKAIKGDTVIAEDMAARVHTLRHLLKQVGHNV